MSAAAYLTACRLRATDARSQYAETFRASAANSAMDTARRLPMLRTKAKAAAKDSIVAAARYVMARS